VPASVKLRLYKQGEPVGTGHMRDLSRDGLFLSTDFDGVRVNDILQIELSPSTDSGRPDNRMQAIVIYKEEDGLGMLLTDEHRLPSLTQLYSWLRRRSRNGKAGQVRGY
jgi:hypothetical protein